MKFENIVLSRSIIGFKDRILTTYPNLNYRYVKNKPMIFFGVYTNEDLELIKNHNSYSLIIWGGSDSLPSFALRAKQHKLFTIKKNIFHIAQSLWIANDLKLYKYAFKQVAWYSLKKHLFNCCKKGKCIYIYKSNEVFYGKNIYNKIRKELEKKYQIIDGIAPWLPHDKMPSLYNKCFIGLRLVPHDGLASTVQELGLMGIKCVHNGNSPSALNYNTISDILSHIEKEAKTIGTKDEKLAEEVKKYLTIPNTFFNVDTYFKY